MTEAAASTFENARFEIISTTLQIGFLWAFWEVWHTILAYSGGSHQEGDWWAGILLAIGSQLAPLACVHHLEHHALPRPAPSQVCLFNVVGSNLGGSPGYTLSNRALKLMARLFCFECRYEPRAEPTKPVLAPTRPGRLPRLLLGLQQLSSWWLIEFFTGFSLFFSLAPALDCAHLCHVAALPLLLRALASQAN